MEFLDVKNKKKKKSSVGEFNSRVERAKGRLHELEDETVEITLSEQVDWKKDVWDYNEKSQVIGVPGELERGRWNWKKKNSKKKNGQFPKVVKAT